MWKIQAKFLCQIKSVRIEFCRFKLTGSLAYFPLKLWRPRFPFQEHISITVPWPTNCVSFMYGHYYINTGNSWGAPLNERTMSGPVIAIIWKIAIIRLHSPKFS